MPEICLNWFRGFLCGRRQRVKIGKTTSSWLCVNGGVPQGTLSGPELFRHMVSDLHTKVKSIKYVDGTTLIEIVHKGETSKMQSALEEIHQWSLVNNLHLNLLKTKEILIDFRKNKVPISPLQINGVSVSQVNEPKLLGVIISRDLKWDSHVKHIHQKASKRLYYLRELKRSGVPTKLLCKVYISIIRPVLEYACPVWCCSLSKEMRKLLESVQKRTCRIILPKATYTETCLQLGLPNLETLYCHKKGKSQTSPSTSTEKI